MCMKHFNGWSKRKFQWKMMLTWCVWTAGCESTFKWNWIRKRNWIVSIERKDFHDLMTEEEFRCGQTMQHFTVKQQKNNKKISLSTWIFQTNCLKSKRKNVFCLTNISAETLKINSFLEEISCLSMLNQRKGKCWIQLIFDVRWKEKKEFV